jgi:UDP-N-acetylmuramoylalanine--D-glutamate ligase
MGKTGLSTVRFLLAKGARVFVSDAKPKETLPKEFDELVAKGIQIETGRHRLETFLKSEVIVVSPGVPLEIPFLVEAQRRGKEVISEIELAWRFLKTPLIAVTGTNGKTTTTSLLAAMFGNAGKKIFVGGNIGVPLIDYAGTAQDKDYVIAEISSFQLEGIRTFRPFISVLLNLTEDHLDRYASFDDYSVAKNPNVRGLGQGIKAETFYISMKSSVQKGIFYNGALHFFEKGTTMDIPLQGMALKGTHNLENIMAAATVGCICKLPQTKIQDTLLRFTGLEHRMEFVDEVQGIQFYNDSKGTNVGAVSKSIESLDPPLILIAGGKDKGGSYQPLIQAIAMKVKKLILLGEARHRMHKELGREVPTELTDSLEDAVGLAFCTAVKGDTVLFSPGCSSFDMFRNYEHRGQCFKALVRNLKEQASLTHCNAC